MTTNQPATPLFRATAIASAAGSQIGDPLRTHWRGVRWFTAVAFLVLAALVVFAAVVEYAPVHRVAAYTDAQGGLVRLRSPGDGLVVSRIAVEEGAVVKRGALLAVLTSDRLRADGGSQHSAQQRRLEQEQDIVDREIDAARQEAEAQRAMTERRLAGLAAERDSLRTELRTGEQLLASLTTQSEQFAALAGQGFISGVQSAQKRDEVTAQASRIASVQAALARVERDLQTAQTEQRLTDARLAGTVQSRSRSRAELERQILAAQSDAEQALRAPQDGTVSAALVAQGQTVDLGQALFTITPSGSPLVLRLLVPARAAGAVAPGGDLQFTLRAYPPEKFGRFAARITSVSNAPAMPADLPVPGLATEPVYLVVAQIPAAPLGPDGKPLLLKPGMLADALVPVERRSVLEWIFDPILRAFNDSAGRRAAEP